MIFPWANRASVVSKQWETFAASNNGTLPDLTGVLQQNNVLVSFNPLIASTAMRITRYAIRVGNSNGAGPVTMIHGIETPPGKECDPDVWTNWGLVTEELEAEATECFCGRYPNSVELDVCDIWRPFFIFFPVSIVRPRVRLHITTEMR